MQDCFPRVRENADIPICRKYFQRARVFCERIASVPRFEHFQVEKSVISTVEQRSAGRPLTRPPDPPNRAIRTGGQSRNI